VKFIKAKRRAAVAPPTANAPVRPAEQIYADIPRDLYEADEALRRYGQWAAGGRGGAATCGSAEGMYRPPRPEGQGGPSPVVMAGFLAMDVQRALQKVPEVERFVLLALYVPVGAPAIVKLRRARIPPVLARERHLRGLRMFDNVHRSALHFAPMLNGGSLGSAQCQPEASPKLCSVDAGGLELEC
jgi:hypothetical protein